LARVTLWKGRKGKWDESAENTAGNRKAYIFRKRPKGVFISRVIDTVLRHFTNLKNVPEFRTQEPRQEERRKTNSQ
jgi:hypothetical protein